LKDLEKKEYLEESQLIFAEDSPSQSDNKKAKKARILNRVKILTLLM